MNYLPFRKSIIGKVLLLYILCLFAAVSAVVIYSYHSTKEHSLKSLNEEADSKIKILTLNCETLFRMTEQMTYDISYIFSSFKPGLGDKDIYECLATALTWNSKIESVTIAFLRDEGKSSDFESLVITKNPLAANIKYTFTPEDLKHMDIQHRDFSREGWYIEALKPESHDGKWFGDYFDQGVISFAYPLFDYSSGREEVCGIIKVDLKLEWLINHINSIKIYKSGFCTFLSGDGDMLGRNGNVFNIFDYIKKNNELSLNPLLEKVMVNKSVITRYFDPLVEEWFLVLTYPYESWWFGIVVPENELYADMFKRIFRLLIVGMLCLLLPIPLVIYLTMRQTRFLGELTRAASQIGQGNFEVELPKVESSDEIGVLSSTFYKMKSDIIEHIESVKNMTKAKEQIEKELDIAKSIQKSITPTKFPIIEEIDFKAFIKPAKSVGGDFYDFFNINDDLFCFMVGDISGKSISGAMFMAISRTMIRSRLLSGLSLKDAVNSVNATINSENESGMFLTLFAAILNLETGVMEFCNAGHCQPLICREKGLFDFVTEFKTMPGVGMIDFDYETSAMQLKTGDALFIYTDGVTESLDANLVFFGEEKLLVTLNEKQGRGADDIIKAVFRAVADHQGEAEQSDDICMAAVKIKKVISGIAGI